MNFTGGENMFLNEEDERNHRIIEAFMHILKDHRMLLERHLNRNGLFRGQHQVLMCIFKNPDTSQKELARFHNVSTAAIAVALKKLEKGGYVERMTDREDNRFNKVKITEKGYYEVEQSLDFFKSVEKGMMEGLSESDKEALYGYLRKISLNLGKMLGETKTGGTKHEAL